MFMILKEKAADDGELHCIASGRIGGKASADQDGIST
jgi:hypothetical protein